MSTQTHSRRILILFQELSGYFWNCLTTFAEEHEVEIHVFRYVVNPEAPFEFGSHPLIRLYQRQEYDYEQMKALALGLQPELVLCCSWADKPYLKLSALFRKKVPTIIGFDNKWENTLRQQIGALLSPMYLKWRFSHAWVPGKAQANFARKLGFRDTDIREEIYCADVPLFDAHYQRYHLQKEQKFPRRLLFLGRYVAFKGIADLVWAFEALVQEGFQDWQLWCIGTGELAEVYPSTAYIKHIGFVQPSELAPYLAETGVFVLPSHREPWGVVVHELATAGFPMICSDQIGAAERFLEPGVNGFSFPAGDREALKIALAKIMSQSDETLLEMGRKSREKALTLTPKKWAYTLNTLTQV